MSGRRTEEWANAAGLSVFMVRLHGAGPYQGGGIVASVTDG